jgi:abortive infection bacteriophage resistance protein
MPNPQAGGPPPVGSPQLLIQYIRSYPPYLKAVSSIRNLKAHHAVVTRDITIGPKRDEVTGDWRKLHNEEIHNLYFSPSIIRMMK